MEINSTITDPINKMGMVTKKKLWLIERKKASQVRKEKNIMDTTAEINGKTKSLLS